MIESFKPTKAHQEQKWKQAITLLNDIVKIKLSPSPIHGIGVFAMRDIKKGEKLYADAIPNALNIPYKKFKDLRPEVKDIILNHWPQIINGLPFLYPVTKFTSFFNHSDKANYDSVKDITLKDIKEGEEIFVNYKLVDNFKKIFKWLK